MAKSQIDLKREQGKCQTELKNRLFRRVHVLVDEYMQTEAYTELLSSYIHKAMAFAGGEQVTIYINPTDEDKKSRIRRAHGSFLDRQQRRLYRRDPGSHPCEEHSDRSLL